mmetsp:Transcript_119581/g.284005  ORF Transcript_119581/g.284005 Transcript_119581/m.284005 type:complete len:217 (-) Transcript_119581:1934-2584(-)
MLVAPGETFHQLLGRSHRVVVVERGSVVPHPKGLVGGDVLQHLELKPGAVEEQAQAVIERLHDELVKALLAFSHLPHLAVAEGRARQADLTFEVTLQEELRVDACGPLRVQGKRLRAAAYVAELQHKAKHVRALLHSALFRGVDLHVHVALPELLDLIKVLGQIGVQDHPDRLLAEGLTVSVLQVIENVATLGPQHREEDGAVHHFQHAAVVVEQR